MMLMCSCYDCTVVSATEEELKAGTKAHVAKFGRMFLCDRCGNKRCPRAKSHLNPCTRSNEPGQRGSLYEAHQRR